MKNIFWGAPQKEEKGNAFFKKGGSVFWGRLRKVFFYFPVEPGKKGAPFFKKVPFSGGAPAAAGEGGPKWGPGKIPREK